MTVVLRAARMTYDLVNDASNDNPSAVSSRVAMLTAEFRSSRFLKGGSIRSAQSDRFGSAALAESRLALDGHSALFVAGYLAGDFGGLLLDLRGQLVQHQGNRLGRF